MYYTTRLKLTETPHESLRFAVLDGYSAVVAYCVSEDRAILIAHALNNYVTGSDQDSAPQKDE